jgi:hypothetical protein
MPKILLSYKFLYYSIYKYCSKVWGFSKDWPEAWAVIIISVFLSFFIGGIAFLSLALFEFDFHGAVADSRGLQWMPEILRNVWHFLLIIFFNMYYFVMSKKWKDCVELYDKYPEPIIKRNYWLSGFLLAFFVAFYLGSAFYLEHIRDSLQ